MAGHLREDYAIRVRGALLAAAVGDALGWPQETRSRIVGGQKARDVKPEPKFRQWDRSSGTQYARYRETIAPGEYSDDTQLLLAVARCCLSADEWLVRLTQVELPAWTLYQRGAGRAVIAAGRSWADGHPPWIVSRTKSDRPKSDAVGSYYNAGANGAAMRIAPHAILTIIGSESELTARVITDSITTHGHPRALIGALLQAIALRHALLQQGTLEYGDLIETLIDDHSWQDSEFLHTVLPPTWLSGFEQATRQSLTVSWKATVREAIDLLLIAQRSLARGAMANDQQTFDELGCYDKTRNGAGTVTAVAAAYAATRAAARPVAGLVRTAFLPRADTDTLASMTASLLGALHGTEWLGNLGKEVQDADYLVTLSTELARAASQYRMGQQDIKPQEFSSQRAPKIAARELEQFRDLLFSANHLPGRKFLDGRRIAGGRISWLEGAGRTVVARARLQTEDGQTLVLDKITRRVSNVKEQDALEFESPAVTERPRLPHGSGDHQHTKTEQSYDFDVALSYAGENRSYVYEVANNLRANGVRVFYDEFYTAELWGQDLYAYLDNVYRERARFTVVFISRSYVAKPWPSHERQSAQARALNELGPYLLPVRFDDSVLPGLRPTVSYLDASRLSPDQLAQLIIDKLRAVPGISSPARPMTGVPRTPEEQRQLLMQRPPAWEYMLFASVLLARRSALEEKWRDNEIHYARRTGSYMDLRTAISYLSSAASDAGAIGRGIDRVLAPEAQKAAFGDIGEPGDPAKIEHLATRLMGVYEEFLDWSANVRGVGVPRELQGAFELAARLTERPARQIREFVDYYVAQVEQVPKQLQRGEIVRLNLALKIDIDKDVLSAYSYELDRLRKEIVLSKRV